MCFTPVEPSDIASSFRIDFFKPEEADDMVRLTESSSVLCCLTSAPTSLKPVRRLRTSAINARRMASFSASAAATDDEEAPAAVAGGRRLCGVVLVVIWSGGGLEHRAEVGNPFFCAYTTLQP